jgi:hypothetical protein
MAVFKKWLIIHIFLLFCLIPLFGAPIFAGELTILDKIVKDFQPISGYLIKVVEDDYILDLDSSHGVGIGDLLSVIQKGEKLIHPVTQKVVGTLEETKGILKITRIKTGYSYARFLKKDFDFKTGDVVRRYDNLNAVFWDYTNQGRTFFGKLQSALPDLKWQDYDVAQQSKPPKPVLPYENETSLFFILTHQGFEVRDPQFFLLHTYVTPESPVMPEASLFPTLPSSGSKPLQAPGSVINKKSPSKLKESSGSVAKKIEYKATYQDMNTVGELTGTVIMADFNRFGEKVLMAATDGTDISIYKVSQGLALLTTATTPSPGQILALQWWRPSATGPLYLSVLSWSDNEALSTIFSLTGGELIPVHKRIPRILGAFDLDGDKQPETLLSQEFDAENFFGRRIKELKLIDGKVRYSKAPFGLPDRFTVLGSHFADLTGDAELESIFIRSGVLYIFSGKKLVYTSPKQMGGSLSFLTYDVDPAAKNVMTTSAAFEVSPITMDLNGDGTAELLAVASDKSYLGSFGVAPGIKKSWLAVVKFSDGKFHLGTLGQELKSPIQGLVVSNKKVLVVTSEGKTFSGDAGKSYLFAYPADQ